MKTRIFSIVAFLCGIFLTQHVQAQVTSVNYQLKYNTDSCRYDAYIIINAGSATTAARRTQTNAQYSIVVPTGTTISVARSYMPLQNNQTYTGTTPTQWAITTSVIAPAAAPEYDFHSITPNLSVASQYNNLNSGDTVRIFSLNVSRINSCGDSIRIFQNGVDPNSSAPGMGGGDFSNGFTIGGPSQRYNANSTQINPPTPVIVSALTTCSSGIEIDLTASTSACQEPLTYSWTGPFSYSSTSEDVNINPSTLDNVGDYEVIVTDSLGCKDSVTVTVTNKPNAGGDQTVCAGTTNTITGTDPTTGTWSARPGNPAGATLGLQPAGVATVTFSNTAGGTYGFIYSTPTCADTMIFTVNAKPAVSITGSNSICVGANTTLSPASAGWVSNNTAVATVSATGVVTAVGQGAVTFTYTDGNGCSSTTNTVTVNPPPTVAISGTSAVCIGSTTTLIPTTGGTWLAIYPAIATVTNAGLVTGISAGTGRFVFTETATGCKSDTIDVDVRVTPTVTLATDSICVNSTTTVTPATGGTWQSSNTAVATVTNGGTVTGLSAGTAFFTWTETSTGCSSAPTNNLTVLPRPTVSLAQSTVCVGNGTTASATPVGGTWVSLNPAIATINATTGAVTTIAQGLATFRYTDLKGCQNTTSGLTINPGPTVLAGSNTLCIGQTTNLTPNTGGTWGSSASGVATVNNAGLVTAVSAGSAIMTYTETSTGCQSSLTITVHPRPVVSVTGNTPICVGFTSSVSPTTGGTWTSLNPAIASVNNSGLVTGLSVGSATFVFTSSTTTCPSLPTSAIQVINKPVVAVTGPDQICVGFTTTLSPTTGGTWASNNTSVATVDPNTGVVTAVGPGNATFTFTATSGCVADPTQPVTVYQNPNTSFTGPSSICIGNTTTVTPTAGGVWSSSNTGIATITNAGLITGISAGTAQLIWTETSTGCASNPLTVTINPRPTVALTGPSPICIGGTTNVTPTTGGVWASSNTSVATITNAGVITGVAQGTAIFVFTSTAGCPSDPIISVAVLPKPTITVNGPDNICIGTTTTLSSSETGTWSANHPLIATIDPITGVVTGVAEGVATFKFTSTNGCVSDNSDQITVNPKPIVVVNGPSSICVGKTTNLSPTTGGTWTSTAPLVASVTNTGLVTGLTAGTVRFIFTQTSTGCSSDTSNVITVTQGPAVSITGDTELCIGETTTLSPSSGGTWETSNAAVATVTNAGIVTAISAGQATFRFTDAAGCKSDPTTPVIVHPKPTVAVSGPSTICVGGATTLSPTTGGTWISSNPGVASVTDAGVVSGISPGSATFTFTDTATGCTSNETSPVTVAASPTPTITGPSAICIGGTTTLEPSTGGSWVSSNPAAATVTNGGLVVGVGPGKVTFSFTLTATGCSSTVPTDTVTITHCLNPDINATFVDVPVNGDVSTNDYTLAGTNYGRTFVLLSSPSGSLPTIDFNDDGTYTFQANLVGVYVYSVPACTAPQESGCPVAELVITVTDYIDPAAQPIANVDFATTIMGSPVTLLTLANDDCMRVTGCSLDPASVVVTVFPLYGTAVPDVMTGDMVYTPNPSFAGIDILTYQVCVVGEPANCATAKQVITVAATNADNSTVALDDFKVGPQDTPISGNVSTNDSDPEGDLPLAVTPYTSSVAEGDFTLLDDGSWTFTPAEWFFGPVEFKYTSCDTGNVCADATLHLLIVPDLTIKVRVYLEGSLMDNQNQTAGGRPLMRDNLRVNGFTGRRYIPDADPYRYPVKSPVFENGNPNAVDTVTFDIPATLQKPTNWSAPTVTIQSFQPVATGLNPKFDTIPNPTTVFAVTGREAIVDWVYIELRDKNDNTNIIATRTGLLQRDGDVADLDGIHGLRFPGIAVDDYYVVVRHFRHLGVMTNNPQTPAELFDLVDFTTADLEVFDFGNSHPVYNSVDYTGLAINDGVKFGYRCLWAGDFDGNGKIKADNPGDDLNIVFFDVFGYPTNESFNANFDFAYGYLPGDFDMNGKSKFDNPNDDKNMLYTQLLFYFLNEGFLSNFDFFIEQLP